MMEGSMFLKGFMCGWLGMAAIILFLVWGMTPRVPGTYYDYQHGNFLADEYWEC